MGSQPDTGPMVKRAQAMTSENVGQSAVAKHAMDEMYVIIWVQVVDSHPRCSQWHILEACHIRSERNNPNSFNFCFYSAYENVA